jgi:hypothetical protein
VPITFFDLLDDDGWEPLAFDPADPSFYWNDGGFMTAAPVDIAANFDGAMWHSTNVEAAFRWRGRRIRAGFTVPKRHHSLRQLMIVVDGSIDVATASAARKPSTSARASSGWRRRRPRTQ